MKIQRYIILPVVLYGCESWSLTLREKHRLRMFKNSMLRNTVGPKREKVMRQETYRQQEVAAYMYFAIITFSHILLVHFL